MWAWTALPGLFWGPGPSLREAGAQALPHTLGVL